MSSVAAVERPRIVLRPLALPAEHGGWGFLLEPIALGLIVAPSAGGAWIAAGALLAFLARHPLKLMAQDWMRGKRYPRTRACRWLALSYGGAACLCFAAAPSPALIALAVAVPFALTQLVYDVRSRGRALTPELIGAAAPGAVATAIALASGQPVALAATLWLLVAARAIPSILYVRWLLRGGSRLVMIAVHIIAVLVAAIIMPLAALATAALLFRALLPARGVPAKTIGMRELAWGAVTVGVFAAGYITA